jgi:hypothetical protein
VKVILLSAAAVAVLALPIIALEATPKPQPVLVASTTCDPSVARAYPNAQEGAAVYVSAPGLAFVTVDVEGSKQRDHRRITQQIPRHRDGAEFSFGRFSGLKARSVNVSSNGWTCTLTPPPSWGTP